MIRMTSNLKLVKLSPAQEEEMKKVKSWKWRPVTLLAASQPEDYDSLNSLIKNMKGSHVTFLLLHSSKAKEGKPVTVLSTLPGFRSYSSGSSSLQLMVYKDKRLEVERIHVGNSEEEPLDLRTIWVAMTEPEVVTSTTGVNVDRQTLIGCVEDMGQGGERALVRQIVAIKNRFPPDIEMMLVFVGEARTVNVPIIISAGVGVSVTFSKTGLILIASPNVKYDLDHLDGVAVVRQDKRLCLTCKVGFRTSTELLEHNKSAKHNRARLYRHYLATRETMLKNPHDLGLEILVVEADPGVFVRRGMVGVVAKPKETKKFKLMLRNIRRPEGEEESDPANPKGIILDRFGLAKDEPVFQLEDNRGLLAGTKLRLKYNKRMKVTVTAVGDRVGIYQVPALVGFYHETHSNMARDADGDMAHVLSHMGIEMLLKVRHERPDYRMMMEE